MKGNLKIHLKANERIFINGAVFRADRKVAIELLNNVVFLLEAHILQEEDATTPLRQLYFIVQSMLMEPQTRPLAEELYRQMQAHLILTFKDQDVLEGLVAVRGLIERGRTFDALKSIRALFPYEAAILGTATESLDQDKRIA